MGTLRIMIADDHDLVRRGVRMLLEAHPGWTVCAEAHSGREAVAMAEEFRPDIAILDFSMPELNGLEAARKIKKISPNTEMLILSMHHTDQLVREIIETGAKGYIIKSDSDRSLVAAVEALAIHKPFLLPAPRKSCWKVFAPRGLFPRFLNRFAIGLHRVNGKLFNCCQKGRAARKSLSSSGSVLRPRKHIAPISCASSRSTRSASSSATQFAIRLSKHKRKLKPIPSFYHASGRPMQRFLPAREHDCAMMFADLSESSPFWTQ